jgi:GNAT superfamily N-acetyltransferase
VTEKITVREAKPSDKTDVLKFCEHTFEWGDYIPNVWDYWLTEQSGRIFVATINEAPVGMSHVEILKQGEAWLEGARTAQEFRRRGVASLLNKACLEFAVKNRAKVARLATDSTNLIAQKALAKLGFKQISDWALAEMNGCELETSKNVHWAEKSDVDKIWRFLTNSKCYAKSAGLFTVLFRWASLDRTELEGFVERNMVVAYERSGKIQGLALIDDEVKYAWQESAVQTCYVDGNFDTVVSMGRFLKNHCYNEGIAKIYGAMCKHAPLMSAFSELGFVSRGNTELVYEKRLL